MLEGLPEFLRDSVEFVWPFRIVDQWERGGYYVFGIWWKEVGPGCWPVIPWFFHIEKVSHAPHPIEGHRQDITLADGTPLTFVATATAQVFNTYKALNDIEDYKHSATVLLGARLAEKLATYSAADLKPESRPAVAKQLGRWVHKETRKYGVRMSGIGFPTFVLGLRTFRLISDTPLAAEAAK